MAATMMMSLSKLLFIILVTKSLLVAEALKCYQCGQYNDGVGSITPCLNYTEQSAPFYLKDCPRSSDAYCIKYESELSVVRDCVAHCTEKEVWNTRTYCCNEDACNDAFTITISKTTALVPATLVATLYASTIMFRRQ